jgi:hypothetical protein
MQAAWDIMPSIEVGHVLLHCSCTAHRLPATLCTILYVSHTTYPAAARSTSISDMQPAGLTCCCNTAAQCGAIFRFAALPHCLQTILCTADADNSTTRYSGLWCVCNQGES